MTIADHRVTRNRRLQNHNVRAIVYVLGYYTSRKEADVFKFFRIVDDAGIRAPALAERMGVSHPVFWRAKAGRVPPTYDFMRRARAALRQIGIRRPDGEYYTVDDLFYEEDVENALKTA